MQLPRNAISAGSRMQNEAQLLQWNCLFAEKVAETLAQKQEISLCCTTQSVIGPRNPTTQQQEISLCCVTQSTVHTEELG